MVLFCELIICLWVWFCSTPGGFIKGKELRFWNFNELIRITGYFIKSVHRTFHNWIKRTTRKVSQVENHKNSGLIIVINIKSAAFEIGTHGGWN